MTVDYRDGVLFAKMPVSLDTTNVHEFEEELDRDRQREAVNLLCESLSGYGGIFAGTEEDGYFYIIGAGTAKASDAKNTAESTAEPGDARRVNALLKERLSARGGGAAQMVMGDKTRGLALVKDSEFYKLMGDFYACDKN